jgi:ribosomal protein S18 acetylase RimI-like enzyme
MTDADIAAVADLMRAYAASLEIDLAYQDFEGELAALPGAYAPPNGALLLARDASGGAAGCVAIRPLGAPGACEMKRLYVADTARGAGLGRRLAQAAIGEARRIGYRSMHLDTLPSMQAAQALYRALGFEPCPPHYVTPIAGTVFLRLRL